MTPDEARAAQAPTRTPSRDTKRERQRADLSTVRPKKVSAYLVPVGRKLSPAAPEAELLARAVTAAEMASMRGKGVSVSSLRDEDPGLPLRALTRLMGTPAFLSRLRVLGIAAEEVDHLSDRQVALLALFRDTSLPVSERQKCKMLAIPYTEYLAWLDEPLFRSRYREVYSNALVRATEQADIKLAEMIEAGNLKAIEYANAMTGKYRPGGEAQQTVAMMLAMIQSVVQRHVRDEATLMVLSHEFERLARGEQVTAINAHAGDGEDILDVEPEPDEEPLPDGDDTYPEPQPDRGRSGL